MPPNHPVPTDQMVTFEAARDRAFAGFAVPAVTRVANPNAIWQ
jgi:hypothetical protein